MRTLSRLSLALAITSLIACGGPGTNGALSGKVTFADMSDASGLAVSIIGPSTARVETPKEGTYSFDKLVEGIYLVSIEAPNTREGRVSFGVEVKGTAKAPDIVLNGLGNLKGTVLSPDGPVPGAQVTLAGSDRTSITDDKGGWAFTSVPAGEYTLVAKAGGLVPRTATAAVKITRGKNNDVQLSVMNDVAVTGKLEGQTAFANGTAPAGIKVSIGTDFSAMTDANGKYSITVPPGNYELKAEAAGYPTQSFGRFTVYANQTTTVPFKAVSLFRRDETTSTISGVQVLQSAEGDVHALVVATAAEYGNELYALNGTTLERRLLGVGIFSNLRISRTGKYIAYQTSFTTAGLVVINTATGAIWSRGFSGVSFANFSTDESTLFVYSAANTVLHRIDLNTATQANVPITSFTAASCDVQTVDRYLIRPTVAMTSDVQLITPTTNTVVFTGTGTATVTYNFNSAIGFVTNCAAVTTCSLQVLGTTQTAAVTVSGAYKPPVNVINGNGLYLGFTYAAPVGAVRPGFLVKVADGSVSNLAPDANNLQFNETSTRVVTASVASATAFYELREEAIPTVGTGTPFVNVSSATGSYSGQWLSPTRYLAFQYGPAPKKVDIKAGVATTDSDVVASLTTNIAQNPVFAAPGAVWTRASTSKKSGTVYDSADLALDMFNTSLNTTFQFTGTAYGARSTVGGALLGKYAVFSDTTAVLLDGVKGQARILGPGRVANPVLNPDRLVLVQNNSRGAVHHTFDPAVATQVSEPTVVFTPTSTFAFGFKGGTVLTGYEGTDAPHALFFAKLP